MIYDLHSDLLCYLASHPMRLAYDDEVRCSISQLLDGGVQAQTLPVFTVTGPGSEKKGLLQVKAYKSLTLRYPGYFHPYFQGSKAKIATLLAFENASSFCADDEPLEQGVKRFKQLSKEVDKPLYVSLTWNTENRFGGGSSTKIGLKEDGKRLLDAIQGHVFAIDMSHTSDRLAHDILTYIEKKNLSYKVIASHSNLRKIQDVPRNLPDEIADEIVKRKGIIGFNFICNFLGNTMDSFLKHIEHALKRGYKESLALGADFFYDGSIPRAFRKPNDRHFFDGFDSAASFPKLIKMISKAYSPELATGIAYANLQRFLERLTSTLLHRFLATNNDKQDVQR